MFGKIKDMQVVNITAQVREDLWRRLQTAVQVYRVNLDKIISEALEEYLRKLTLVEKGKLSNVEKVLKSVEVNLGKDIKVTREMIYSDKL